METEKLTLKDWQLYPNAKGSMSFKANDFMINNIEEFIIFREKNSGTILRSLDISKWKLILRPIESLTEEEKEILIPCFTDSNYFNSKIINPYNSVNMMKCCFSFKIVFLIDKLSEWNIDFRGFLYNGKAVAE